MVWKVFLVWALWGVLGAPALLAATISEVGTVTHLRSDQDRAYQRMGATRFATAGGTVTLDVLGRGFDQGPNRRGLSDPYLYLFSDDGDVGLDDFIALNDDSRSTYGDGSVHRYDSFLSVTLRTGRYVAFVGGYGWGNHITARSTTARARFVPQGFLQFDGADPRAGARLRDGYALEDYRLTITGDGVRFADDFRAPRRSGTAAAVPLPIPLVLLGGAVAGLAGLRCLRPRPG